MYITLALNNSRVLLSRSSPNHSAQSYDYKTAIIRHFMCVSGGAVKRPCRRRNGFSIPPADPASTCVRHNSSSFPVTRILTRLRISTSSTASFYSQNGGETQRATGNEPPLLRRPRQWATCLRWVLAAQVHARKQFFERIVFCNVSSFIYFVHYLV